MVLFEKSTFLVISHYDAVNHEDIHRFEKISNIIKQFKLSCIKTNYAFVSMVVKNEKFTALIDEFTSSTYIMVIVSDTNIEQEAITMNIKASREYFESIVQSNEWLNSLNNQIKLGYAAVLSLRCKAAERLT